MAQLDLVSSRRLLRGQPHRARALAVSILFHGFLFALIIGLSLLYHPQLFILHNGSASGAPMISLQTIVIVAPLSEPAPPAPPTPPQPATTSLPVKTPPLLVGISAPQIVHPIETHTPPPEAGVPVLAGPTTKPILTTPPVPAMIGSPAPRIASSAPTGTATGHLRPAGANFVSSYAPGTSTFPHPPYPSEARDMQETGVVRMMIQFDVRGDVARADVAQSSGVAILDSATRSYIYANWHSQAFAGKAVSVPVEYTLTSL